MSVSNRVVECGFGIVVIQCIILLRVWIGWLHFWANLLVIIKELLSNCRLVCWISSTVKLEFIYLCSFRRSWAKRIILVVNKSCGTSLNIMIWWYNFSDIILEDSKVYIYAERWILWSILHLILSSFVCLIGKTFLLVAVEKRVWHSPLVIYMFWHFLFQL